MADHSNDIPSNEAPLDSWKEIAAYLQRDVSTAIRWEKSEDLPVHRHHHLSRASVYAYPSEIDVWRAARKPKAGEELQAPPWRRMIPALSGGLALLGFAAFFLWGPILNPPRPLVEASEGSDSVAARQVWADDKTETSGRVSRDGRHFSFVDWETGDVALRDLETGNNRLLTNKGSFSEDSSYADWNVLSPDNKQVAYVWFNAHNKLHELRVVGPEGADAATEPRVLYANEDVSYLHPMDWFPDGSKILVLLARKGNFNQIVSISVDDGALTVIKSLDWRWTRRIRLSPNGRYLAYDLPPGEDANSQRDIRLLAADGSFESTLVEHPSKDNLVGWTPDGGQVLFTSDRTGSPGLWAVSVTDGKRVGSPTSVKRSFEMRNPLGFGPGGSLYYGQRTGLMDVQVAQIDFVTGKLHGKPSSPIENLVGQNRQPAWSPDGHSLAYIQARGTVAVRSIETGEERSLASGFDYLRAISWTPDGQGIIASGSDNKTRQGAFRIDVETGEVTPLILAEPDSVHRAQLSPSGNVLYYRSRPERGPHALLRRRDLRTGEDRVIYEANSNHMSLSSDGKKLVIREKDASTKEAILKVLPAQGGEPRELLRVTEPRWIGSPEWSPDSRYILFWRKPGGKEPYAMWRISAEGGDPQQTELSVESQRAFSIHPDGKRIAYTKNKRRSEVWVLENFLPDLRAAK